MGISISRSGIFFCSNSLAGGVCSASVISGGLDISIGRILTPTIEPPITPLLYAKRLPTTTMRHQDSAAKIRRCDRFLIRCHKTFLLILPRINHVYADRLEWCQVTGCDLETLRCSNSCNAAIRHRKTTPGRLGRHGQLGILTSRCGIE